MTTRHLSVLFAILAVFGFVAAACGSDEKEDTAAEDPGTEASAEEPDADEPSPDQPELGYTVRSVPDDYATIKDAVDAAEPGDLVLIGEGIYNEAVIVETDEIVIRGIDRNAVILDGEHDDRMENGIKIFANGVAVENLTIRNYTHNGLFWTGDYASDIFVEGYRASYVTTHNIGVYGMYAFNAIDGQIDHAYAGGSDDSAFYIGQCEPCNALLYEVEAENSQLGYSGTNSSGTIIANSYFHDNMIGVVPNSQDGEELAPNRDTLIIGNLIANNNNQQVPSRNTGFQAGSGSGVILAGAVANIVERNTIVGNERGGVIIVDWVDAIFGNGTGRDFLATDNIIRDNTITGSLLDADIMVALNSVADGGAGNCFENNDFGASIPVDAETVLPCGGEDTAELQTLVELLAQFNVGFEPIDYKDVPAPAYDFDSMPDAATAPPEPAINVPMAIDLDAIIAPPIR